VPAPGPGLSPEFRKTRGEAERREGERSETRREARRAATGGGRGNESGLGLGGRAAGAGAYIAQPPTGGSPPQRDDPTVTGGAGGRLRRAHRAASVPHGPRPCLPVPPLLSGRARASAVGLDRGPGTARRLARARH